MTDDNKIKISPIRYYLQYIFDINRTNLKSIIKGTSYNYETINKKLKENTIRYQELKDLLNVIDYDLIIVDEEGKKFEPF